MVEKHETGMTLLHESADALEAAAVAAETADGDAEGAADAGRLRELSDRIRRYLAASRPTTTLGMPSLTSGGNELSEAMVIRRAEGARYGHVRIVPD